MSHFNEKNLVYILINKRAQWALGRSPEEKVKGHSGDNIENPRGII